MNYHRLGRSGLRVSCLGFGTHMNIGDTLDERESLAMLEAAHEAGINLIDTADSYTRGAAEAMLGKCLPHFRRSDWVILTKVFGEMGPGPNDRGLSAKHIREGCDASLRRLGLDYVDIYMCHQLDPEVPIEETVRAMGDVLRAGKALYWGVSNWPAPLVVRANALARSFDMPPMAATEDRYNMIYRHPESALFPALAEEGIGCVAFSPLAHGMLAGVYKPGQTAAPAGTRVAREPDNKVTRSFYYHEEFKVKAQELVRIAGQMGTTAAALATAWCVSHHVVSSVLLGAWNLEQLKENLRASDVTIPPDVAERLDKLFPLPQAAPGA
ncbi:MAG: aldo/keto reductase [Candidatus Hydrogenedentes bacterium]|nr:aldo/keto reductase [Candidatus Hydrogenedentota bacterium]